jgi:ribosomal protein S18 acetylase RimI-like enzyme
MIVRQLNYLDAAAYQALRLLALQESPSAFGASYAEEAARTPTEIARRVTPTEDGATCTFGAFVGDELAGIMAFVRERSEKVRHKGELCGVYIPPAHRRKGLASALLDEALRHARAQPGLRQVTLSVNATNHSARALYESRGFTRYGVEPDSICVAGEFHDEEYYFLRLI